MILDAGFLISVDRGEDSARAFLTAANQTETPLRTSHAVVAQVWRDGTSQTRLASFLKAVDVHPLDDGRAAGRLLALAGGSDVVDAHLVTLAVGLDDAILTGDRTDIGRLAAVFGPSAPTVHAWP